MSSGRTSIRRTGSVLAFRSRHPAVKVTTAPGYGPSGAWDDFPLREQLQRATALPAVIENGANVLAEYEYVYGESQEPQSLVAIVLDEGVRCGMIADGRLIHGVGGQAGEIGHLVVQPRGRTCRCGNQGCLDSVASTVAIPEVFDELAGRGAPEASDLATVIAYFEKGDEYAAAALDQAGDALGVAIATLLRLINPEKLVLFGPAGLVCESSLSGRRAVHVPRARVRPGASLFYRGWRLHSRSQGLRR